MQHKGTVRLETDRLILRRFRLDDSGAAFQNWTSDKRVTEFLRWPAHDTVNTTKKIIQMWVDGYAQGTTSTNGRRFEKQRKWARRYDQRC